MSVSLKQRQIDAIKRETEKRVLEEVLIYFINTLRANKFSEPFIDTFKETFKEEFGLEQKLGELK
jgi:hypothetical protein